jgi:tRNA uridine 5-carboxymethylaminomethyl modification enzyme
MKHAEFLGIINPAQLNESKIYNDMIKKEIERLEKTFISQDSMAQILKRPENHYNDLPETDSKLPQIVKEQVEIEIKYAGYIERERRRIEKVKLLEHQVIFDNIDYWEIKTISYESREKLSRIRPANIAQAAGIPGISPADIAILAVFCKNR